MSTTSPLQEDEVDQTTPDKVDSSSLSAILSDHPSDHGREGGSSDLLNVLESNKSLISLSIFGAVFLSLLLSN